MTIWETINEPWVIQFVTNGKGIKATQLIGRFILPRVEKRRFSQLRVISAKRPQQTHQSSNCISFSAKPRILVLGAGEGALLGMTGAHDKGSYSAKVTQRKKERKKKREMDSRPNIFPLKTERTRPFKGAGGIYIHGMENLPPSQ